MREPTKFVNLHAHSNGSIGDAISLPPEHFEFARQNGLDAHAITDHGNMNTFSHSYKQYEEYEKKGVPFKVLYGNEAYFIPSLKEWEKLKQKRAAEKAAEKLEKKSSTKKSPVYEQAMEAIVTEFLQDEENNRALKDHDENQDALVAIKEDAEGNEDTTVVENEEETKALKKPSDPLRQRNHLVLLAKNLQGLKSLFKLTSLSYRDGMYYFPRMDFDMLREHAKGNIIASSACLGSALNNAIIENTIDLGLSKEAYEQSFTLLKSHNFDKIQKQIEALAWQFVEVLGGIENYYLEIQFNKLPYQHILNYHLIELSKRTGIKLLATADCHYPDPKLWKERLIYKAMSKMTAEKLKEFDMSQFPQMVEELECELYPKNAKQMWDTYINNCVQGCPEVYNDPSYHDMVCDAIERSHDIAHNYIDKIPFDRSPKLPSLDKLVPINKLHQAKLEGLNEEEISFNELVDSTISGLTTRGLIEDTKYVDRAMEELDVIRHLKLPKYFLTCAQSLNLIGEKMFLGAGRGCFLPNTPVKLADNTDIFIQDIKPNQFVYTHNGEAKEILRVWDYDVDEEVLTLEFQDGRAISCTKDHKFLTASRGWVSADNLTEFDEIVDVLSP